VEAEDIGAGEPMGDETIIDWSIHEGTRNKPKFNGGRTKWEIH